MTTTTTARTEWAIVFNGEWLLPYYPDRVIASKAASKMELVPGTYQLWNRDVVEVTTEWVEA